MIYKFLINLARQVLPEGKFKHALGVRFKKQYSEYKKSLKSTDFSYSSKKDLESILIPLLEKCIQNGLGGDVIECGVYRGGSSFLMAKKMKELGSNKKLFALDTFEGQPYDDRENMPKDLVKEVYGEEKPEAIKGTSNDVDLNEIKRCFSEEKLDNTIFIQGLFEDSFKQIQDKNF